MAAPTPNWSLPLLDGSEPGVFKTVFNALSNALEAALDSAKSAILGSATKIYTASAGQVDMTTTGTSAASVTVPCTAGASYIVHGNVLGGQVTGSGAPSVYVRAAGSTIGRILSGIGTQAVGATAVVGDGSFIYTAASTGNVTFDVYGTTTSGAFRNVSSEIDVRQVQV